MKKLLQKLFWYFICEYRKFDGGVVLTRGNRYFERGRIVTIEEFNEEFIVIIVDDWIECNVASSLATWSVSPLNKWPMDARRLFVETSALSWTYMALELIGFEGMSTFEVPGLGACKLCIKGSTFAPRLGSSDFIPEKT